MAEKFLVIQTAFIGDVVLATGLCEKLHNRFPEAEIYMLVRKGNEGLFEKHPFVKVMIWEKKTAKYKNLFKLLFLIRSLKFTRVINIQRYAATGFLTAFSGAKERIGFDKNPFSRFFTKVIKHEFGRTGSNSVHGNEKNKVTKEMEGRNPVHEIERNNQLIAHFTDPEVFKPRLYPGKEEHVKLERYKRLPYITISPASVWFTKQWPIEKWLAFLDKMSYDFSVYILGGPGDEELGNRIKQSTSNPYVINFCGKLNYLESLSMIKDATMNYVNDSAPMHFASSVNAPVTAIYCSTVPSFGYGPVSDHSHILQFPGELYCRPCGLHGHNACPEGHFRCALEIDPKQLIDVLPPAQIPSFQRNH